MSKEKIRNFAIIAHIDHGKSTLADRFLEITGTVNARELKEQTLDTMELERERGITIKLQPARMDYKGHTLNLIDTPGHVDFSYEVSRSLTAVEGALLVVDASQGIEAQTLSTLYAAIDANLTIIPVINKIDLPHAEPEKVTDEIVNLIGCAKEEIILASGKTGEGVTEILDAIIGRIPAPKAKSEDGTRALIFDSFFDPYKGVMVYIRVFDGAIKKGEKLRLMAENNPADTIEVGYLRPKITPQKELAEGEIGYIVTGLKETSKARVGDTITTSGKPAKTPLPGYKKVKPFVYAGVYTTVGDDFPLLREALEKLSLSDSSLSFEPENSKALGFGFRCGFLGLLHMEIVKERLEREFNLSLITTAPSVSYEVEKTSSEVFRISSPADLPEKTEINEIREPYVNLEVISPSKYIGSVMELLSIKRGKHKNTSYLDADRALLSYECPLSEIVTDFYDKLKSVSSGYASVNYEFIGYRAEDLVKVDILINAEPFDTLSIITHRAAVQKEGEKLVKKLKEFIPRQNFKIPLQAAIGGKIIAREDISAFRKNVTEKLYGGDVTRKQKLLKKQKKGKERMKMVGRVEIPSDTFIKILKS
ncbi:MAG: translation elongation factor 4 [Patescibacteria group bacterium]|nr:translation elongation factor 4 [Patescibacteria group bacterium]